MSSKLLDLRVPITELPTLVKKKSKQTDLNDTPELMSLPINDLSYWSQPSAFLVGILEELLKNSDALSKMPTREAEKHKKRGSWWCLFFYHYLKLSIFLTRIPVWALIVVKGADSS